MAYPTTNDSIPLVSIPCLVIQLNNQQFISGNSIFGKILNVPCRSVLIDDIEYWLVPQKENNIFTGLKPVPAVGPYKGSTAPSFDSIKTLRVRDKESGYTWWVYGTKEQFYTSCRTSADASPTAMPGTDGTFVQRIAPCDTLCLKDGNGAFFAYFGLPTLGGGQVYRPIGSRNNVAYTAAAGGGYANIAALLVFLNASYTPYTWTNPNGNVLLATGGSLNDQLCVQILNELEATP